MNPENFHNRSAGQVIIGAELLEMFYRPDNIAQVAVCNIGDPLLETICERRKIKVWLPKE